MTEELGTDEIYESKALVNPCSKNWKACCSFLAIAPSDKQLSIKYLIILIT